MKITTGWRTAFGSLLALTASACSYVPPPATPFTRPAFAAAQKAGEPILVAVHANWCPTCRAQDPTIASIGREPAFARLKILRIDFDSQEAEWKALGVQQQSTLIAYNGFNERARATGIVDPAAIRALAAKALN